MACSDEVYFVDLVLWTSVNGTSVKPVAVNEAELFRQNNEKALAMIMVAVKTTQFSYVENCCRSVKKNFRETSEIHFTVKCKR